MIRSQYVYINDLIELESHVTGLGPRVFRPATPLKLRAWQRALADHPDRDFCSYILSGIAHGFHIGCDRAVHFCPCTSNLLSVNQQSQLVDDQSRAEAEASCLLGPLPPHLAPLVQTNRNGMIPKPHQPGKWRLIVDLSIPAGTSIIDAISPDICHRRYASVVSMQPPNI